MVEHATVEQGLHEEIETRFGVLCLAMEDENHGIIRTRRTGDEANLTFNWTAVSVQIDGCEIAINLAFTLGDNEQGAVERVTFARTGGDVYTRLDNTEKVPPRTRARIAHRLRADLKAYFAQRPDVRDMAERMKLLREFDKREAEAERLRSQANQVMNAADHFHKLATLSRSERAALIESAATLAEENEREFVETFGVPELMARRLAVTVLQERDEDFMRTPLTEAALAARAAVVAEALATKDT
jgi:hypothetical protein